MAKIYKLECIEPDRVYTLEELCERRHLETEFVIQCVDYGIAEAGEGGPKSEWLFPVEAALRLEKAFRLHRDLGLDFNGLAIVLDLLEDIDRLNGRIDSLKQRLDIWESG